MTRASATKGRTFSHGWTLAAALLLISATAAGACVDTFPACPGWANSCASPGVSTYCPCMCAGGGGGGSGPTPTPAPAPKPTPTPTPMPAPQPTPGPSGGATVLYSGTTSGTYYYDIHGRNCPGGAPFPENNGYGECASNTPGPNQQTLAQMNTNNVIAMDHNLLAANRTKYCGKKVIVTYQGRRIAAPDGGDFFIWDGCVACEGGGRLDFSLSGLLNVNSNACTLGVVPGVGFQVVDQVVKKFVP